MLSPPLFLLRLYVGAPVACSTSLWLPLGTLSASMPGFGSPRITTPPRLRVRRARSLAGAISAVSRIAIWGLRSLGREVDAEVARMMSALSLLASREAM